MSDRLSPIDGGAAGSTGSSWRGAERAANAAAFFDGTRLTLARQLRALRKNELAGRVGVSAAAVTAWEAGSKHPTRSNLAGLTLTLGVAPEFFVGRASGSTAVVPHFRSLRSTTQVSRDQARAFARMAVDIATVIERHVELPVPASPLSAAQDLHSNAEDLHWATPEETAAAIRELWGLGQGPVRHMVRTVENHGVLVVFSWEQGTSVDAYSFDTAHRPVIVLNPAKRDYYRQRFDVAHELGHLVLHSDTEPGAKSVEEEANRFASELLMPEAALRGLLPTALNRAAWARLGQLKEEWGVSLQALLFRARALGNLSDVSYRNAMTRVSANGWRRAEPGLITRLESASLLPQAVDLLDKSGVSAQQLREECHVPDEVFTVVTSREPA